MKLLNFGFVLVVLCGVFQKSYGENLNCDFKNESLIIGTFYTCVVTPLDNTNNNIVITGYSGSHKENKTDKDVEWIWIKDTNTKYIPKNLGLLFNLTVFMMTKTHLIEIKSQEFIGMQDLETLSLSHNLLTSVPIDAFSTLPKLKIISLSDNQIKELPNGVFGKTLQLEWIFLYENKIKFLGSNLFDGLPKLNHVDLDDNICIDKEYGESTEIIQLKTDIQRQCINPNEITASMTTK